ncbi:hypothetical protein AB0K51_24030 [Kitasatospora sp. NPDC049285]|uniref:hypothetical protein n=1 Tax=Kitasatospora sp. NPDC049285 TaxID=3157096 RepID=UPI003438D7F3
MKITLIAEEPTDGFLDDLRTLLAKHAADVVVDTGWTSERASRYYLALPPRAQRILEEAVARGGTVAADDLRGEDATASLKGHAAGLTRTITRAIQERWLPSGIESPVQGVGPGYGKVLGYRVHTDQLDLFRDTVLALPCQRRTALAQEITERGGNWNIARASTALGLLKLPTDFEGAAVLLRHLADVGHIVPGTPGHDDTYQLGTSTEN